MIIDIRIDTEKDNVNDLFGKLLSTNQSTIADNNVKPVIKTIRKRRKTLTEEERREIKLLVESGERKADIAQLYDVSYSTVCRI